MPQRVALERVGPPCVKVAVLLLRRMPHVDEERIVPDVLGRPGVRAHRDMRIAREERRLMVRRRNHGVIQVRRRVVPVRPDVWRITPPPLGVRGLRQALRRMRQVVVRHQRAHTCGGAKATC